MVSMTRIIITLYINHQTMRKFHIALVLAVLTISAEAQVPADPEKNLSSKNIVLPAPNKPIANYVTSVRSGNLLFLSGHGYCGGVPSAVDTGKLGKTLTIEQGYQAARNVGLCMLATIKSAVGDLNRVKRVVRVFGMVNSTENFKDQPKVMNGFSDLMVEVFGENGKHVRAAVGMVSLPNGIAVEVEMTIELKD
jgi:enamine deaminase RidA (YjgF/YER057c/UK114 family)